MKTALAAVLAAGVCLSCSGGSGGTSALADWENLGHDPSEDAVSTDPASPSADPSSEPDESEDPHWFLTRGVVCGWDDVDTPSKLDYLDLAREHGLNTFSIYNAPRNLKVWSDFMADGERAGVKFEFEEHMMTFLLPRDLFNEHPEYFRMNEMGVRVPDANGCPSSEGALAEVRAMARIIGENYMPTNHRFYFWLDDGGGVCHCPLCKDYNDADQALIFENTIMEALKELDQDARLAHLCYANTTEPPRNVTPHKDIFLEFAPFWRSWSAPLSDTWTEGLNGMTHAKYLKSLHDHLEVFPAETAQVLEYWMDDSMFSGWNKSNLKPVPWDREIFLKDLDTYASYGIRHIMCYSAYVGPDYVDKFGYPDFLVEYADALNEYRKK